jgi:hypothetical protein
MVKLASSISGGFTPAYNHGLSVYYFFGVGTAEWLYIGFWLSVASY